MSPISFPVTYIHKAEIADESDIIEPIQDALAVSPSLKVYGRFRSMIDYLSLNQGEMRWVDLALNILGPTDGWVGLNHFVANFFGTMAPLLPRKGESTLSLFEDSTLSVN